MFWVCLGVSARMSGGFSRCVGEVKVCAKSPDLLAAATGAGPNVGSRASLAMPYARSVPSFSLLCIADSISRSGSGLWLSFPAIHLCSGSDGQSLAIAKSVFTNPVKNLIMSQRSIGRLPSNPV